MRINMKKITTNIAILSSTLLLASCMQPPTKPSGPRTIVLNNQTYNEAELGKFTSWICNDGDDEKGTLIEVGIFSNPDLQNSGFILFDGGYKGDLTKFRREGVNSRWDWGPNKTDYAFITKPDGTGFYYDFSSTIEGGVANAPGDYECEKK
jgi:hypothetical protein